MNLEVSHLAGNMTIAMHDVLSEQWSFIREYAEAETRKLAESFSMLEKLKSAGQLDDDIAKLLFDIQKNACRTVLLTAEGMGIVTAEVAINAAIEIVRDDVNSALDFALL